MAIYLDSADVGEARAAADFGFVAGFTTNPVLIARHEVPGIERLAELLGSLGGRAFYQPLRASAEEAEWEAREAVALAPDRVVVKLPARQELFALAARLRSDGIACAMTAVYAPAQALVAQAVGAGWVIPYVDRARRLDPGGDGLVRSLASVLRPLGGATRILAASLKDPAQLVTAVADGSDDATVPFGVLARLADHPLSEQAVAEFEEASDRLEAPGGWGARRA